MWLKKRSRLTVDCVQVGYLLRVDSLLWCAFLTSSKIEIKNEKLSGICKESLESDLYLTMHAVPNLRICTPSPIAKQVHINRRTTAVSFSTFHTNFCIDCGLLFSYDGRHFGVRSL